MKNKKRERKIADLNLGALNNSWSAEAEEGAFIPVQFRKSKKMEFMLVQIFNLNVLLENKHAEANRELAGYFEEKE